MTILNSGLSITRFNPNSLTHNAQMAINQELESAAKRGELLTWTTDGLRTRFPMLEQWFFLYDPENRQIILNGRR